MIFRSGALYHSVCEWEALPKTRAMQVTPGRFAVVFFTPLDTLKWSQQREHREGIKTGNMGMNRRPDKGKNRYRKRND